MKAKLCLLIISLSWTNAYSQGTIGFSNNPLSQVVYNDGSESGNPAGPEVRVGFYYSSNLDALPRDLVLAGTTDTFAFGLFSYENGAPLILPVPSIPIIFEIRAWTHSSGIYATYEEAIFSGDPNVWAGVSGFLGPMEPRGPMGPGAHIFIQGGFSGIVLTQVPEPSVLSIALFGLLGIYPKLRLNNVSKTQTSQLQPDLDQPF